MQMAKQRLSERTSDPLECEMQSWSARWRGEALDHYLSQGWSYGALKQHALQGYLLAQPLLFFRGLTQTLWVEHLESYTPEVSYHLLDSAYRWARDKHFQCLLIEATEAISTIVKDWKHAQVTGEPLIEIRSARF